jgi:hypothetical protein
VTYLLRTSFSLFAASILAGRASGDAKAVLESQCYKCHSDGTEKGNVNLDLDENGKLADKELWLRVLKNVRAGLMPPPEKAKQPSEEERAELVKWVRDDVFHLDPQKPDPGRPILRRLNRTEYRNTVRELMGVDFKVEEEFPADDSGHGFDTIGEVLSLSPMLMEKYLEAAKSIVGKALPVEAKRKPFFKVEDDQFRAADGQPKHLLYYREAGELRAKVKIPYPGTYHVIFHTDGEETYVEGAVDLHRGQLKMAVAGKELGTADYGHAGGKAFRHEYDVELPAGEQEIVVSLMPLAPQEKNVRNLGVWLDRVEFSGPAAQEYWEDRPETKRWFPQGLPKADADRKAAAESVLRPLVQQAFRRPVEDDTLARLVGLAEHVWQTPGESFENGLRRAMEAVLASPRFLFREEFVLPAEENQPFPLVEEYTLASRLSYFFWSNQPDAELMELARGNQLRQNLRTQIDRLMADKRAWQFVEHFVGQWLQARDVESVPIDASFVLLREQPHDPELEEARKTFMELRRKPSDQLTEEEKALMEKGRNVFRKFRSRFSRSDFSWQLRNAMHQESEHYFAHVLFENKPIVELLQSDYTFLNERLAKHYGLPEVKGDAMQRITLPADSPRGGILTHGTVLAVTSNPTRTSPVKRGLFILDNILGSPPPPPPPNIPALEDFSAGRGMEGTLRQNLERHRADPKCAGCHNRMDPIGLAFENFNAMGGWRALERGQKIDPAGKLVSGESFQGVRELKQLLATKYLPEFQRCLAEKLLIYALGRGLTWQDEATLDSLMQRLQAKEGRLRELIYAIVEADVFQRRRRS